MLLLLFFFDNSIIEPWFKQCQFVSCNYNDMILLRLRKCNAFGWESGGLWKVGITIELKMLNCNFVYDPSIVELNKVEGEVVDL